MAAFINNDITAAGLLVLAKGVAGQLMHDRLQDDVVAIADVLGCRARRT